MSWGSPLGPLPLLPFQRIMQEPLQPVEWDVEPIMARGDRVIVYGEFGSLKSWLLLDLSLHLAAGRPWLGQFTIPQPRRVLYIDEEMNQRTLRRRIKRLGAGSGLEKEALAFQVMSRVGVRFDDAGAKHLLDALEKSEFDPEIVIVEAFRRVLIGSENEAKDVAAFWRNVELILRAGKTLVVSHHMRKPNLQGEDKSRHRASGSTDILAGADTAFAIQRIKGDLVVLEGVKSREAEEIPPFAVSLTDEGEDGPVKLGFEGWVEVPRGEAGKLAQALKLAEDFLAASLKPVKTAEILGHLKARGIGERTGERALKVLKEHSKAAPVGHGSWGLLEQADAA